MEVTHKDHFIGKIIFKSYLIKKKLGEGSFGKVYVISNIKTNELFAAKFVSKFFIQIYRKKGITKMNYLILKLKYYIILELLEYQK